MRLETRNRTEDKRIGTIDAKKFDLDSRGQGMRTEVFVNDFYNSISGFKARISSLEEDKGAENGGHQTVDVVASFENGGYAFAAQITGDHRKESKEKKLKEMKDRPFIRLPDMKAKEIAIPKVLIFLDPLQVKNFFESNDPTTIASAGLELMIKVIDDHIRSLTFDLSQTKNPVEQAAVKKLIDMFMEEKKKYIH